MRKQEVLNMTYKIIRIYAPHLNKKNKVMGRGLSLQEVQKHCNSEHTRKEGVYFDGYIREGK